MTTMFQPSGETPKSSVYFHYRCNDLSIERFKFLQNLDCDYINIGEIESGEKEKGNHFHVAIKFKGNSITRGQAAKLLQISNVDKKAKSYYLECKYLNATSLQWKDYCIKNGSRYEKGMIEVGKKKINKEVETDIKIKNKSTSDLYKLRISKGIENDWGWFQEHDPKWTLSAEYSKLYAKYFRAGVDCNPIKGKMKHYWIYGKSGTGKSSSIEFLYPDRYKKIMTNEKWDGYDKNFEGHKVVHIDELNSFRSLEKGMEGLDGLKCKVDRNPFSVRKNYGVDILTIRPESFIITSNYTPSQLLCKVDERGFNVEIESECLNRKFNVMHIDQWLAINRLACHPSYGIFDLTVKEEVERYNMACQDKELYDDKFEFLR